MTDSTAFQFFITNAEHVVINLDSSRSNVIMLDGVEIDLTAGMSHFENLESELMEEESADGRANNGEDHSSLDEDILSSSEEDDRSIILDSDEDLQDSDNMINPETLQAENDKQVVAAQQRSIVQCIFCDTFGYFTDDNVCSVCKHEIKRKERGKIHPKHEFNTSNQRAKELASKMGVSGQQTEDKNSHSQHGQHAQNDEQKVWQSSHNNQVQADQSAQFGGK